MEPGFADPERHLGLLVSASVVHSVEIAATGRPGNGLHYQADYRTVVIFRAWQIGDGQWLLCGKLQLVTPTAELFAATGR